MNYHVHNRKAATWVHSCFKSNHTRGTRLAKYMNLCANMFLQHLSRRMTMQVSTMRSLVNTNVRRKICRGIIWEVVWLPQRIRFDMNMHFFGKQRSLYMRAPGPSGNIVVASSLKFLGRCVKLSYPENHVSFHFLTRGFGCLVRFVALSKKRSSSNPLQGKYPPTNCWFGRLFLSDLEVGEWNGVYKNVFTWKLGHPYPSRFAYMLHHKRSALRSSSSFLTACQVPSE